MDVRILTIAVAEEQMSKEELHIPSVGDLIWLIEIDLQLFNYPLGKIGNFSLKMTTQLELQ